jgi:hypothetical protein
MKKGEKKMKTKWLLIFTILLLLSCDKYEFDNLVDPEYTLPSPKNLNFSIVSGNIHLTWTYSISGIDGFQLERKVGSGSWQILDGNIPANTLSYTDTDVETFNSYSYRIRAKYSGNYSGYSDICNAWALPENFVFVAGGTFHNGTSNVTLSSFYIGRYEVTQAGYEAVMGTNPSHFSGNPNRPVERVSWFNTIEYCNRRSIQEGLTPAYSYSTFGTNPDTWPSGWNTSNANHTNVSCNWSVTGYRLPTEMEWMFAAKGGNQSQGYTYSGSNNVDAVAWYSSNSGSRTHDVGTKAPNELLTYDMSGNVWEWCWDIWGNYPSGDQTNPTGAASGSYRILRGGSWYNSAYNCTVTFRNYNNPTFTSNYYGFRILRSG